MTDTDIQIRHNKSRYVAALALRTVALLPATGPIMQTFLASLGFSSQFIYINSTLVQAVNILCASLFAQWADHGSIVRRAALIQIPHALLYLCYLPLCLWKSPSFGSFAALTGICLLQSACIALYTVCEYKLPYYIYGPKDYGTVLATSGIVCGLISLGAGILITELAEVVDYGVLMLWSCVIAFGLMTASGILYGLQKVICQLDQPAVKKNREEPKTALTVFKHPVFYRMIPANFFRGFAFGTTTVIAGVALDLGFGQHVSTAVVTYQSAAMLLGCILFAVVNRYVSTRLVVLIGSLAFLLVPVMLVSGEEQFLLLFAVVYFGKTLVDYGVPSLLRLAVPVEIAGPYNAWRMNLHTAGMLLATSVAALIPVGLLLVLTMAAQVVSGLCYYAVPDMKVS